MAVQRATRRGAVNIIVKKKKPALGKIKADAVGKRRIRLSLKFSCLYQDEGRQTLKRRAGMEQISCPAVFYAANNEYVHYRFDYKIGKMFRE